MQGFELLAFVVGPPRGFAANGDELVTIGPELQDSAVETTAEQDWTDPVDETAYPVRTGDAMMEI